jgi:DNA primase
MTSSAPLRRSSACSFSTVIFGRVTPASPASRSEKTPSFYVNDQKQFYHCFSSGKHGDIFKFVMETEGLSFPEAVERLAGEAGVTLPKMTVENEQAEEWSFT